MMPEYIEETFYNALPNVLMDAIKKGLITAENISDQEPNLYLAMNALTLIHLLESSKGFEGICLNDDRLLTPENCPASYKELFSKLFEAKAVMDKLSKKDLQQLKEVCSATNSHEKENKPEIMSIAAKINSIASQITQQAEFKERVVDLLSVTTALME